MTIFGPLNIHRALIVLFDQHGLLRQRLHLFIVQAEAIAFGLGHIFNPHLLTVGLRVGVDHANLFRPHVAAHDSGTICCQSRFVDIELIRVNRPLHHHFTQPQCSRDKHHLIKAGFGINGKHHARRGQIRAYHALNAGGERHTAMIVALVDAVGDGTVVKQRGEDVLHRHHDGVNTLHIQKGLLLTGKGGIGHILCGCRGADGKRGVMIIGRKLLVGVQDGGFQFRQEGGLNHPLTNLFTRFGQRFDIINVGFIQQRIDSLVQPALIQEEVKGV